MLGSTDQVEILAFDLVHHSVHLIKGHNACYNVAVNHVRRDNIGESLVDHEVASIAKNCGMKACDVAHEVIESITCNLTCSIHVDTVEASHNVGVVGNLEIGNYRFSKLLDLYIM